MVAVYRRVDSDVWNVESEKLQGTNVAKYLIAQINIHDRNEYGRYEAGFVEIFSQYHPKMLAVDEAPESLEGEWSYTRTVLIEFPTDEDAMAWYQSPEYQKLAEHRFAASTANLVKISGM